MPLTLNVGTSKKLGMPDFGSLGASCNLSVELSSHLIDDPDALQRQIRNAYAACSQAGVTLVAGHRWTFVWRASTMR